MNEPEQSKKKGSPRPRSEVSFPYYDLDSSVEVAAKIHDEAGGSCTRDQLAPMLGYSGTKNGGFLSRLGAARMFGLVEEVNGSLRPTALASQIYAPIHSSDSQRGKVQAFLNIELFNKVYERFKGQPLPNDQGLENLLRNDLKVVPAQIKNALRTLHESAESAGFFNTAGRGRLVIPVAANAKTPSSTPAQGPGGAQLDDATLVATGTTGGGRAPSQRHPPVDEAAIPPAIYGLIRDLPPEGTAMTKPKRERLIKAFEASINWLYPDEGEEDANE